MPETEGYSILTASGSVYSVKTPEFAGDKVTQTEVGRKRLQKLGHESQKLENERATVIFISDEQAALLHNIGHDLRSRGYRVGVRAIASTQDAMYFGREPQINNVGDALENRHYLERGGSFRLFVESGKDFSLRRLDLGPVGFVPEEGKRGLFIPRDETKKLTITGKVEDVTMAGACLRLAQLTGQTF